MKIRRQIVDHAPGQDLGAHRVIVMRSGRPIDDNGEGVAAPLDHLVRTAGRDGVTRNACHRIGCGDVYPGPMKRIGLATVVLLGLWLAPGALGDGATRTATSNQVRAGELTEPCPGDAIAADRVITGSFGQEVRGSYVLVPFEVPAGTTAVRVKYCYDKPESPTSAQVSHTIDLGLYGPRKAEDRPWGVSEFRGWGGSSHPDVTVSDEGYSTEEEYRAKPKGHVAGRTTRGFRPGPIEAGRWAAELGVPFVVPREQGDADGAVAWRVEIELADDPAFADEPYRPAPYPRAAVRGEPGWYAGDMHVHGEHSALGDATMTELFDFAFRPRGDGGAGLDFVTLSDYVSGSSWGEIGRYAPRFPGKLIMRSAEVITYRGHLNSHANATNIDYRTGPLLERRDGGELVKVRGATDPSAAFRRIRAAGGFTQINHPTIFPSSVPLFQGLCRGCPWDYSAEETDYRRVDAWEVHTGPAGLGGIGYRPGPNPFTLTAIERWDELRRQGHRVTAVAVSDSHNAGRSNNPVTQSPIGQGTTVVYADELSERGVQRAIRLGHAFVKLWAADDPDLRLEAVAPDGTRAIMGDPLAATRARFTATVLGGRKDGQERQLVVLKDGEPITTVPVSGDEFRHEWEATEPGDYRLQLQRGSAIDALSNPITLGASPLAIRPRVRPGRAVAGVRKRFVFRVRLRAQDRIVPLAGATVRFAGRTATTGPAGVARIAAKLRRPGRYRARVSRQGLAPRAVVVRVRRASR